MPETNMVMFNVQDTKGFIRATRERDLWINPMGEGLFRAVTHLDVSADDIEAALDRLADVMKKGIR